MDKGIKQCVIAKLSAAVALFVLPESPRWLVVNAQLDEALAVIHRIYTDSILPFGSQESTAEVEQELMELWSSVEKDKAAARERNQALRRQKLLKKVSPAECFTALYDLKSASRWAILSAGIALSKKPHIDSSSL